MFSALISTVLNNWKISSLAAVLVAVSSYVAILHAKANHWQHETMIAQLQVDSVEAEADTTREINGVLSDSLHLFQRRAVQTRLERDSLSQALHAQAKARVSIEAKIDSLRAVSKSTDTVAVEDGARIASFTVDQPPFHIKQQVIVPAPPAHATLHINLSLDSIPLGVLITCQGKHEINKANVAVIAPNWADIRLNNVRQDPGICNPKLSQPNPNLFARNRGKLGIAIGAIGTWALLRYLF